MRGSCLDELGHHSCGVTSMRGSYLAAYSATVMGVSESRRPGHDRNPTGGDQARSAAE